MKFKKVVVYMDEELYQKYLKLVSRRGMLRRVFLYEIAKEGIEQMYKKFIKEVE